jgi:hypothetical protein
MYIGTKYPQLVLHKIYGIVDMNQGKGKGKDVLIYASFFLN